jgi:hypothetical protein
VIPRRIKGTETPYPQRHVAKQEFADAVFLLPLFRLPRGGRKPMV